jgi:drug/metabolite transporter (DMT)-like permease
MSAAPTPTSKSPHAVLLVGMIAAMVLMWSFNFIVGKVALRHFDPLTLAAFRVILSALILVPIYLARPRKRAFGREDAGKFIQLGLLGVALNQVCFTIGLNYTTVAHSSLIIGMGPIYVLLLAWFQGLEAVTLKKLGGMLLAFSGVAVLAAEHGLDLRGGTLVGDLITLAGSWAFAFYTVLGKKAAKKYESVEMNFFNYLAGAVVIAPLAVRQALQFDWAGPGVQGWAALVYMAALASVAAYLIYFWALRHVAASRLVAFGYLHPVLATVLGIVLLGERLTMHLLVGGGLVLVGVYLTEVAPAGETNNEAARG